MSNLEIEAAQRHLQEVRGLSESRAVIERAEARLRRALGESEEESPAPDTGDPLEQLGLSDRIVEALRHNAAARGDSRLVAPSGLREWIDEGNDLVDLKDIGRRSAQDILKALNR